MNALPASTLVARMLLLAGALTCAIGMVGPFQGVETAFVPWDKAAHFIAFYGCTSLLFVAFPHRRRLDLVVMAACAGCGLELMQFFSGRDSEISDVAANSLGAFAVFLPSWLEQMRATARGEARRERRRTAHTSGASTDGAVIAATSGFQA